MPLIVSPDVAASRRQFGHREVEKDPVKKKAQGGKVVA
jgi:hypothetical protein